MKFRISENSLYAVLMRSPWWVSFMVGAAVFALVRLFMEPVYAAFATTPFVGIGVFAAWRQLRVPHGGVFVLPIPNAVTNLAPYIASILIGTLVTAAALYFLKRPVVEVEKRPVEAVPAAA